MLFISYWELNPDFDPADLSKIAEELIKKGLAPIEGVKDLGWYVTPDFWGISISEIESEEAAIRAASVWRIVRPGVFKFVRGQVAMSVPEVLPVIFKLNKELKK